MLALAWLIPVTLALGGAALAAYFWSVGSGQYEDLNAAAWRILEEDGCCPAAGIEAAERRRGSVPAHQQAEPPSAGASDAR